MKIPALCLLFLFPIFLFSADYYVSPSGNDSNSGSLTSPFRSINRAIGAAQQPGDTVIIRKGTYQLFRTVVPNASGKPGSPITIKSYRNEKVILDGANLPEEKSIFGLAASYIVIEGLELKGAPKNGVTIWGPGNRINNVTVRNCIIRDCQGAGIFTGFNTKNQGAYAVLIEGNQVFNNVLMNEVRKPNPLWAQGISCGLARQVTVRNNQVFGNYGEGIGFYLSDNCIAMGNSVYDNFSIDVYLDNATNCQVIGNRVFSTRNPKYFRFKVPSNGIQIANETYRYPDKASSSNPSTKNIIANNVVYGHNNAFCYGNYQEGGGLIDTFIVNNTFYNSTGELIRIDGDQHRNALIANNLFFHTNPRKQITFIRQPFQGLEFSNNAWFGGIVARHVQSRGDVNADPKLLNPGNNEFQLTRTSPCIDKGRMLNLPEMNQKDFANNTRIFRQIDIGAYEFQ